MAGRITPPDSWDSHVHCFNPTKHTFKPSRSYTPEAAPLSALVASTYADCITMFQASIEDGPRAARLEGVARYGWSLSGQLSPRMWAALADFLLHDEELREVRIIADHNGSATPEDASSPEFETFLGLLAAGRVSVKIGALHRRAPDDIRRMQNVVEKLAASGAGGIVWGSDWPHVDSTQTGETPSPPLPVNTAEELRVLKSWLSEDEWNGIFVVNPAKPFDA
ncbi:uncharacterized protein PG986_013356 [Apiospora aurea]|uniref:Amidohydrolase-related domain-containing protein n=1 Tax=Apiospora aurea TaxID=335848 RepID=A0ABR1PVN1_9PEZI